MKNENGNLPASIEAEKAILGSILLNDKLFTDVSAMVNAEEFFWEAHRIIFKRMAAMHAKEKPIDLVTLTEELFANDEIAKIGGVGVVSDLTAQLPKLANIDHYAQIANKYSGQRKLMSIGNLLQNSIEGDDDPSEIVEHTQRMLRGIDTGQRGGLKRMSDVFDKRYESVDDLFQSSKQTHGLETGFKSLDTMTYGLQAGDLFILAARPSIGKTAFAMNVAVNVAKRDKIAAVFSLEMTTEGLLWRALCAEAGVDSHRVRGNTASYSEKQRLIRAYADLRDQPLFFNDASNHTATQIHAQARRLKESVGLDLVVVDYLQLMQGGKEENRTQQISMISRGLKEAAKELGVPFLVLSQLSRASEDREEPRLSDLRESGQIEQDADVVAFLWRENKLAGGVHASRAKKDPEEEKPKGPMIVTNMSIAKQRNGPTGKIAFMFNRASCRFFEQETQQVESLQRNVFDD